VNSSPNDKGIFLSNSRSTGLFHGEKAQVDFALQYPITEIADRADQKKLVTQ
jgi:hypothetical protein